jgi:site-specific recombinase XerD
MANRHSTPRINTPNQRNNLAARHAPYYVQIRKGLALGFRKPKSGPETWSARMRKANGNGYTFTSLEVDDVSPGDVKSTAEDLAKTWAQAVQSGQEPTQRTKKGMTVGDAVLQYIEYSAKHGKSEKWVKDQTRRATTYVWAYDLNDLPLTAVQAYHIEDHQNHLRTKMTAESVNRQLVVLRAALNWAYKRNWTDGKAEWRKVGKMPEAQPEEKKRRKQAFNIEDRKAFCEVADAALQPICLFMLHTGCRPVEARRLTARDVHLDDGYVVLKHRKGKTSSEFHTRKFTLTAPLAKLLGTAVTDKADEDPVFTTASGMPWSMANLAKGIKTTRTDNQLSDKWESMCFRHSFITDLVKAGIPALSIARVCGTGVTHIEKNYFAGDDELADKIAAILGS